METRHLLSGEIQNPGISFSGIITFPTLGHNRHREWASCLARIIMGINMECCIVIRLTFVLCCLFNQQEEPRHLPGKSKAISSWLAALLSSVSYKSRCQGSSPSAVKMQGTNPIWQVGSTCKQSKEWLSYLLCCNQEQLGRAPLVARQGFYLWKPNPPKIQFRSTSHTLEVADGGLPTHHHRTLVTSELVTPWAPGTMSQVPGPHTQYNAGGTAAHHSDTTHRDLLAQINTQDTSARWSVYWNLCFWLPLPGANLKQSMAKGPAANPAAV